MVFCCPLVVGEGRDSGDRRVGGEAPREWYHSRSPQPFNSPWLLLLSVAPPSLLDRPQTRTPILTVGKRGPISLRRHLVLHVACCAGVNLAG